MRLAGALLIAPPDSYQARTVLDGVERDLGRPADCTTAILRAEKAGTGSTVIAFADGAPMTRDDGTEYIIRTI